MALTNTQKMWIGGGIMAAGGILKASSIMNDSIAKQGYYNYLANKAESDIVMAKYETEEEIGSIATQSAGAIKQVSSNVRKIIDKQTAVFAANGIDSGSNTVKNLALDSAKQADRDVNAILYNTQSAIDKKRLEYKLTEINLKGQAKSARIMADAAAQAGTMNTITSIFDTATSIAGSWLMFGK